MIKLTAEQLFDKLNTDLYNIWPEGVFILDVFGQDNFWGVTVTNITLAEAVIILGEYLNDNDIEIKPNSTEFDAEDGRVYLKFEHVWIDHELTEAIKNFTGDNK